MWGEERVDGVKMKRGRKKKEHWREKLKKKELIVKNLVWLSFHEFF